MGVAVAVVSHHRTCQKHLRYHLESVLSESERVLAHLAQLANQVAQQERQGLEPGEAEEIATLALQVVSQQLLAWRGMQVLAGLHQTQEAYEARQLADEAHWGALLHVPSERESKCPSAVSCRAATVKQQERQNQFG